MELLLGIGREIISPEIGCNLYGYRPDIYSKSLHDDLTATAFAFTYGSEKAILISITVGGIMAEHATALRKKIEDATNTPADNILLSATHTHTGPILKDVEGWGEPDLEYRRNVFDPGVINAAVIACSNQQMVTMGSGIGNSFVGINRRQLTLDNKAVLGQNKWGPFDDKMTILSFQNSDGQTVGNIISYGCHGTAAGTDPIISRDWSGEMTDALEKHTGGITAFFNGTTGDVGPRLSNGKTTGDISYVEALGKVAAADAIRIFDTITTYSPVSISSCSTTLRIPLESRMPYAQVLRQYDPEKEKTLTNLARKHMSFLRRVKESYENGYEEVSCQKVFQNIIRIGDFAFVAFPFDLFSVIGLRIKEAIKDLSVLTLSHSNGSESYFVTQDQICRGGYEVAAFQTGCVQPYPDDADYRLILETLRNFEQLAR